MNYISESYRRKGPDVNVGRELLRLNGILRKVQVNIPFRMLHQGYLPFFLEYGINPEIGFDGEALDTFGPGECREVGRALRESRLSITLHAPFMDLSPGSIDPAVRALTRRRFDKVRRLLTYFRPRSVVCHVGYETKRYGFIKDAWMENSLKTWSRLAEGIRNEGSFLMLENVFEHGPVFISKILMRLRHFEVGFCLDTGHLAAFGKRSLKEWLDELGPFLGQLHLHDNDGFQDEHAALGKGEIDFPGLFSMLKEQRREPPIVTLEPHREEDLVPSLKYLEGLWPW